MAEASSIQGITPGRAAESVAPRRALKATTAPTPPQVIREEDNVEVSEMAMFLSKLRDTPGIRTDLVTRIQGEIARGEYDSPEKLSEALDGMIDDTEIFG